MAVGPEGRNLGRRFADAIVTEAVLETGAQMQQLLEKSGLELTDDQRDTFYGWINDSAKMAASYALLSFQRRLDPKLFTTAVAEAQQRAERLDL